VVISAVQLASEVGKSRQWQDAAQAVVGKGADADIMTLVRGQISKRMGIASLVLERVRVGALRVSRCSSYRSTPCRRHGEDA